MYRVSMDSTMVIQVVVFVIPATPEKAVVWCVLTKEHVKTVSVFVTSTLEQKETGARYLDVQGSEQTAPTMVHVTQPPLSASAIQDGRALAATYLTALVPLTVTTMVPVLYLPLMKTLWYAIAVTPTWGRSVNYGVTMVSLST